MVKPLRGATERSSYLIARTVDPSEWSSTLKGESLKVEGKDFPVAPLRKEADATKARYTGRSPA